MRPDPDRLDWRWNHASEATQLTEAQALRWLEDCDVPVISAYQFKRAMDAGLGVEPDATSRAYQFWSAPHLSQDRLSIECMLLCQESFEQIALELRSTPRVIERYHDLFFDVLPAIREGAYRWIGCRLFRTGLYSRVHRLDEVGRMHRIAWLCGPDVLRAYQNGNYACRDNSLTLRRALHDVTRDYLAKLTPLTVMGMGGQGDLDVEVLRIAIDDMNEALSDKVAQQEGKGAGKQILAFLSSLSIAVADPTDPRNLTLSGREPRAAELIASTPTVPVSVT